MAKQTTAKKNEATAAQPPKPNVEMTSTGLVARNIDDGYRFAQMVSRSKLVPTNYQGQPDNCLVAIDLSLRWGVSWLVVMQHVYMVHDRPALDASLCIALTNKSGIFVDPIEYEIEGTDARKDDYRVRAYATRKSTGKKLYGPWIDWQLVKGEGWHKPRGSMTSKWMTMPDQMFHYRAASWFQRRYCPEVAMGMLTTDEANDMGPKPVESKIVETGINGLKRRLQERQEAAPDAHEPANGDEGSSDTGPEVNPHADDLRAPESDGEIQPTQEQPKAEADDTASIFD